MEDFSTILSTVKPKDRTDQYKILAALYSLGATTKAVTTAEVRDVLALNLGSKIPVNIPARLRDYSQYLRVEKGTPLRWILKKQGVERLRELSKLTLEL